MKTDKDISEVTVAVMTSCYKRKEYTAQTIKVLEEAQEYKNVYFYLVDDGSDDGTEDILRNSNLPNKHIIINKENYGFRNVTIDFFDWAREKKIDVIAKIDNDVYMPKNWLNDMLKALLTTDLDVAACNHTPSNPAFTQGEDDIEGKGYRKAHKVVGLWFMDRKMTDGVFLEKSALRGIRGSEAVLLQIKFVKEPKIGWIPEVHAENIGHFSGKGIGAIKTQEYKDYHDEVGRSATWEPGEVNEK